MTSKMPVQKLLLNWKDHSGALVSVFETLLEKKALVDCTLAAEGQYLKAHKVVLSACSSYFELLFSQESEKNPIVILKDVKFEELEAAVNFMYKGEVEVCEDRLAAFLEVADSLQITGLGSDTKSQGFKENVSAVKSSSAKSALTRRRQSRKEDSNLQSDDTGLSSNVPTDCDQIRNFESSSFRQSFRKENSSVLTGSTFGVGPSNTVKEEINRDSGDLKNVEQSSVLPSFTSGESVQSEENPVIKTEPETDTFSEEQLDEAERDSEDDVVMLDDQDDWDEPKAENMDAVSTNQQDMRGANLVIEDNGQTSVQLCSPVAGVSLSNVSVKSWTSLQQTAPLQLLKKTFCLSCKKTYSRGIDFKRHMCSQSWFACTSVSEEETSNVPSSQPLGLEIIERRSLKGSSFMCSECGYATPKHSRLTRHLLIHTGEKPHKCQLCDFATAWKANLAMHIRTHTGEKPYKCHICGYASGYKANVQQHLKTHREKTSKC